MSKKLPVELSCDADGQKACAKALKDKSGFAQTASVGLPIQTRLCVQQRTGARRDRQGDDSRIDKRFTTPSDKTTGQKEPMKFAYADPPYIGQAKRYYSHDPNCAEVDHKELIERLVREYPDGWALSLSSPTLREILNYCPDDVRVAAWCKSFCAFKRGVRPAYAWEPVIYWRGRNPSNGYRHLPPEKNGKQTTPKDFIVEPITLQKGLVGAKPEKVCRWILQLLNAQPGDTVDDLFPGTGIMGRVAKELETYEKTLRVL